MTILRKCGGNRSNLCPVYRFRSMFVTATALASVMWLLIYTFLDFEYFTTRLFSGGDILAHGNALGYAIVIGSANQRNVRHDAQIVNKTNDVKLILLWTTHFRRLEWFPPGVLESGPPDLAPCAVTNDRRFLKESAAVLFHWRDIIGGDLPAYKYPGQLWIMKNHESPSNTERNRFSYKAKGDFDWIVSYRNGSDVFAPYGMIVPRTSREHPKWSMDRERFLNITKKSRNIAWLVSNCNTWSKREVFVAELMKYAKVDVFGSCGDFKCPDEEKQDCMSYIEANYKFYLSFENSICEDYVTEKLFRTLKYDVIPIVFGGAKYEEILPPNSYIDALAFDCPKQLADYLKWVGEDHQKYTSYLVWKTNKTVVDIGYSWIFDVCTKLHDRDRFAEMVRDYDILKWWFDDANCRQWKLPENCTEEYYVKTYGHNLRVF